MGTDILDVTSTALPFEDTALVQVVLDRSDDSNFLDDPEVKGSPSLDLGDLFYEQDIFQIIDSEATHEEKLEAQVKSCSNICHSRMTGFGQMVLGNGSFCAVKCLALDEKDRRLETLLEVLDRLVDSHSYGSAHGSLEKLTKSNSGSVFLQEIFDIFCEDEKVHVIYSFYERSLGDVAFRTWFRLPVLQSNPSNPIFYLDPDGTFFQHHDERSHQDILLSLKVLTAELVLGLLFLHKRGIVHLGLVPSNVLVTPTGHIQISNFTLAKALPRLLPGLVDLSDVGCTPSTARMTSSESETSVVSLLALVSEFGERNDDVFSGDSDNSCHFVDGGGNFGSLALGLDEMIEATRYSAPELLERDEQERSVFDENADWWSLGMVLWELGYGEGEPGCEEVGEREDGGLKDFTRQLTREHGRRLAGIETTRHRFLNIEPVTWRKILDMKCPPCPPINTTLSLPHTDKDETDSNSLYSVASPIVVDSPLEVISIPTIGQRIENALETIFVDETTHSDIQPFPSTASLYRDIRSQPIQEEDEEDLEVSFTTNDSGLALTEPLATFINDPLCVDVDDDGSPILIRAPSRQDVDLSFTPSSDLSCDGNIIRLGRCMSMDEMVVLSLLRAKADGNCIPGHQTKTAVNMQRSTGIKRRVRKVRGITKASARTVKLLSRFVLGIIRCR